MIGKLIVISGPSAVGKGTVAAYLVGNYPNFFLSVSATTREPRAGEEEGLAYLFWSTEQFEQAIAKQQMLEWAKVHGQHLYGTPREPVEKAISEGKNVILEIDVQGFRQVRKRFPGLISIFVKPPSFEELSVRMASRGSESAQDRARRLETARLELASSDEFDHVVINDEVARCAAEVVELIQT